jgi:ATP-dependent Clp protease ATP-binding subunit ClpA
MWQRFSQSACGIILVAQHEASKQGSLYVNKCHLLTAFLEAAPELATEVLEKHGHDLAAVQLEMAREEILQGGNVEPMLSRDAKRVMELAARIARKCRSNEISSAHLLLAVAGHTLPRRPNFSQTLLDSLNVVLARIFGEKADWRYFTQRAREVILQGQREAANSGAECVEPEHLLLALFHEKQDVAAVILSGLGLAVESVTVEIGSASNPIRKAAQPKLTPYARRGLDRAYSEMRRLNHKHTGTEHILLSLVQEKSGVVAKIFARQGITYDDVRQKMDLFPGGP